MVECEKARFNRFLYFVSPPEKPALLDGGGLDIDAIAERLSRVVEQLEEVAVALGKIADEVEAVKEALEREKGMRCPKCGYLVEVPSIDFTKKPIKYYCPRCKALLKEVYDEEETLPDGGGLPSWREGAWIHRGCGGRLRAPSLGEQLRGVDGLDYVCDRCGQVVRRVTRYVDGYFYSTPDPEKAEYVKVSHHLSPRDVVEIVDEAWVEARKYKDGKRTRDTWLRTAIARVVRKRFPRAFYHNPYIHLEILEYAIKAGLLRVVREVAYDIPYAYRKHGWRGIKATITWRVLEKPTAKETLPDGGGVSCEDCPCRKYCESRVKAVNALRYVLPQHVLFSEEGEQAVKELEQLLAKHCMFYKELKKQQTLPDGGFPEFEDPSLAVLSAIKRLLEAEVLCEHELELAPISELLSNEDAPPEGREG